MTTLGRRGFVLGAAAAASGALAAAACAPNRSGDAPGTPVTIAHAFGETTVPETPRRVVCAGYTGQDDLLAVGVVPIAVTDWFGDQPHAVWPWAQAQLGGATPTVLQLDDGIQVEKIAALKPDLIVATNAGVDADTYQALSAIAPTLPQSGGDAFFEPWTEQADVIGRAVRQAQRMQELIDAVDSGFAGVAADHPGFRDTTVLLLHGRLDRGKVGVITGWRADFLRRMGLVVADAPAILTAERIEPALRGADVLIWTTENDDERAALLAEPTIAAAEPRSIFTPTELAGAIAFASPLSYPVVTRQLPALITALVG